MTPAALDPFFDFAARLRAAQFAVAPDQVQNFIAAVGLLGPRSMEDVRRAGLATLAPPPERMDEFEAIFRQVFFGQMLAPNIEGIEEDEDTVEAYDYQDGAATPPEPDEETESGGQATSDERLSVRGFEPLRESEQLRLFRRDLNAALPRRRSLRRTSAKTGDRFDLRRVLRDAARVDGEVFTLPKRARRTRQRRILLLIDVSGSMKAQTDMHLRLAHSIVRTAEDAEVFTIGTRLTRVTKALHHRNPEMALGRASTLVADWDGGTRLGDALDAFLSVPRFAGFARSALAFIISDGLERGDPATLIASVERLTRLAWRALWLTPLMADPEFRAETAALAGVLPFVDRLGSAGSLQAICHEILNAKAA
ncbi:MAG: VWA domain-containing protein [Pseudomonadota bacterium]